MPPYHMSPAGCMVSPNGTYHNAGFAVRSAADCALDRTRKRNCSPSSNTPAAVRRGDARLFLFAEDPPTPTGRFALRRDSLRRFLRLLLRVAEAQHWPPPSGPFSARHSHQSSAKSSKAARAGSRLSLSHTIVRASTAETALGEIARVEKSSRLLHGQVPSSGVPA